MKFPSGILLLSSLFHQYRSYQPAARLSYYIMSVIGKSKSIRSYFTSIETNKRVKVDSPIQSKALHAYKGEDDIEHENSSKDPEEKTGDHSDVIILREKGTEDTATRAIDVSVGWPPMDNMELGWRSHLIPEYRKPYFQKLLQFLSKESTTQTIFPPSSQIFTAFNLCPYENVKVVIIGQDPYHGPGQAHGLAFSVQKGVPLPPSLKNMINEAKSDPKVNIATPSHGCLECWAKQGVLLLNACLTVRKGEANSHQKQGWEDFTDAVIKALSKKQGVVYLLWGKPAQTK